MPPPKLGRDVNGYPMQFAGVNTTDDTGLVGAGSFSLTNATSNAFLYTTYVRISAQNDVDIDIGTSASATSGKGLFMFYGTSETITIKQGQKISVTGGSIRILPLGG